MTLQLTVVKAFGIVLLLVGLVGFVSNPIVGDPAPSEEGGDGALFGANIAHDLVHLLTGLAALAVGYGTDSPHHARTFNVAVGTVYAIVALLGFGLPGLMGDLLAVNTADNILHVAIALVLIGVGLGVEVEEPYPSS